VLEARSRVAPDLRPPEEGQLAGRLTRPLVLLSLAVIIVLTTSVLLATGPGLWIDKWFAAWPGTGTKNSVVAKLLAVVGQRAYSAPFLLVVAVFLAWRRRIFRPVTLALIGLLALNVFVGAMKYAIARPSPRTGVWLPFSGGTDFPSGHTSNAVLTWGLCAWLLLAFSKPVPTLTRQRVAYGLVALASVVVGAASLYLRTHWISDIVAGWAVGFLILVGVTRLQNVPSWRARLDHVDGMVQRFDRRVSSPDDEELQTGSRASRRTSSERTRTTRSAAMTRFTP
jgi:membrane-associated phospholipid phosphatase